MADFENDALSLRRRQSFLSKVQMPATRLLEECLSGDLAAVQVTLATEDTDLNLEAELDDGRTALQIAAHYGYIDIAQLLVENGAKIDVTGGPEGKSPLHIAVENGNSELARILLEHNASPNKLAFWDAPLHIAVQNENQDILQLLLEAGAVTERLNGNGETPLIIAAGKGSVFIAQQLLDRGADADSGKAKFNSPLLAACRGGHLDMTALLLDCGASIDKADAEDSTPLFFAVQAGNIGLAKLLLRRGASTVIRGISILALQELAIQSPEMLQALQIQGPIQGPRITTTTMSSKPKKSSAHQIIMPPFEDDLHKQGSCRGFDITMVDFYVSGAVEERLPVTASVHKVLYGNGPRALLDSTREEAGIRHEPDFTWYHIPANNLTWAEHLITRLTAENDSPQVTERRMKLQRLEQSARIQLNLVRPQESSKGATTGDPFLKPFCSPCSTLGDDATGKAVMLVLPYLHFETFESFQSMSQALKTAKARTDSLRPTREYMTYDAACAEDHVAEGRMPKAVPGMLFPSVTSLSNRHGGDQAAHVMSPSSLAEYGGTKITRAWSTGQAPSISHRSQQWEAASFRTFPLTGLKKREKAEKRDAISWLSHSEILAAVPEKTREPQTKSNPPISTNPHNDLILGYMGGRHIDDCGFQPRRTLDQYKYSHLGSIGERDGDQVVYRYTKARKHDPKIFMVDQLWMWVLEDGTLVTCAPLRWDAILKDFNPDTKTKSAAAHPNQALRLLFPGLRPSAATEQGPQLRGATVTTPTHLRPNTTKFMRPFQGIYRVYKDANTLGAEGGKNKTSGLTGDPMDIHQSVLRHLKDANRLPVVSVHYLASLVASRCVDVFDQRKVPDEFQFFDFFEQCLTNLVDRAAQCLKEVHDAVKNSAICSITHEIESLIEIADILDELEILKAVLQDQGNVLNSFNDAQARRASISLERNDATSSLFSVDSAVRESHLIRIDAMERSAKKTEESFYRITDLKQKHASQLEAASTAQQARETARQRNAIVLFTVVTIVFLPISFMAAFFTINIDEMHVTENGKLPLAYVLKYMLAVGLGLIIPLIIIAFNLDAAAKCLGAIKYLAKPSGRSFVLIGLVLAVCGAITIIVWTSHLSNNIKITMTVVVTLALLLSFVAWRIYRLVAMVQAK